MQSNRFQPQHIVETASDGQTPRCPSPVVKWAGGKARLLATLEKFYPAAFEVYYEPFLGGGAVFFHLWSIGKIKRAVISDCNKALINCYVGIRDHLEARRVTTESTE